MIIRSQYQRRAATSFPQSEGQGHNIKRQHGFPSRTKRRSRTSRVHYDGTTKSTAARDNPQDDGYVLGSVYGQTPRQDGLSDRGVHDQLCGAVHRHHPPNHHSIPTNALQGWAIAPVKLLKCSRISLCWRREWYFEIRPNVIANMFGDMRKEKQASCN